MTVIGWAAFAGCEALSAVYIYATAVPEIDEYVFKDNAYGRKIYVLSSLVDSYKKAEDWSDYADAIEAIPNVVPPIITEQPRNVILKEGYSDSQVLTVAVLPDDEISKSWRSKVKLPLLGFCGVGVGVPCPSPKLAVA